MNVLTEYQYFPFWNILNVYDQATAHYVLWSVNRHKEDWGQELNNIACVVMECNASKYYQMELEKGHRDVMTHLSPFIGNVLLVDMSRNQIFERASRETRINSPLSRTNGTKTIGMAPSKFNVVPRI